MNKIIATLLAAFGIGHASAAAPTANPVADLRSMALHLSASDIGINPETFHHQVWGVLMETGNDRGYYTLVALADGSTSLYFSNGGGIIGGGEKPSVRNASQQFIGSADTFLAKAQTTQSFDPPAQGATKFFFLTFSGVRVYTAREADLGYGKDQLAPLFHAGQGVITAIRTSQP